MRGFESYDVGLKGLILVFLDSRVAVLGRHFAISVQTEATRDFQVVFGYQLWPRKEGGGEEGRGGEIWQEKEQGK